MTSRPNHPLWTYVLYRIMLLWSHASDKERNGYWNGNAEFYTGPQSLFEGLMFYLKSAISIHCNQRLYALHMIDHGIALSEEVDQLSEQTNKLHEHLNISLQKS